MWVSGPELDRDRWYSVAVLAGGWSDRTLPGTELCASTVAVALQNSSSGIVFLSKHSFWNSIFHQGFLEHPVTRIHGRSLRWQGGVKLPSTFTTCVCHSIQSDHRHTSRKGQNWQEFTMDEDKFVRPFIHLLTLIPVIVVVLELFPAVDQQPFTPTGT